MWTTVYTESLRERNGELSSHTPPIPKELLTADTFFFEPAFSGCDFTCVRLQQLLSDR